jgi:hypothetical protein
VNRILYRTWGIAKQASHFRTRHAESGYRGRLGIIRLARKYSPQRVEAASERVLLAGACRYKNIESI